jgi:hypothetical protein
MQVTKLLSGNEVFSFTSRGMRTKNCPLKCWLYSIDINTTSKDSHRHCRGQIFVSNTKCEISVQIYVSFYTKYVISVQMFVNDYY